jgi:hypothetical protein
MYLQNLEQMTNKNNAENLSYEEVPNATAKE